MAASGPWSTVTSTTVPLTAGTWGPRPASSWTVRAASSREPSPTSRTVAPRSAFSWVGVPSAMTRPWSRTTRVSARRSASSRYWVVSRTVVPPPTNCSMTSHRSLRLCGSRPVVGSSRKSTDGPGHQGRGQVEASAHPARVGLEGPVAGVGQIELHQQLLGPPTDRGPTQVVEVPDHLEVLAAGQVLVDGGVLAGQSDQAPDQAGLFGHVMSEHPGPPAVGPEDGGQNPHRGGLPGAVGSEQTEHGAFGDGEAHAVEGAYLELAREGLLQLFGFDRVRHAEAFLSGRDRGPGAADDHGSRPAPRFWPTGWAGANRIGVRAVTGILRAGRADPVRSARGRLRRRGGPTRDRSLCRFAGGSLAPWKKATW